MQADVEPDANEATFALVSGRMRVCAKILPIRRGPKFKHFSQPRGSTSDKGTLRGLLAG